MQPAERKPKCSGIFSLAEAFRRQDETFNQNNQSSDQSQSDACEESKEQVGGGILSLPRHVGVQLD